MVHNFEIGDRVKTFDGVGTVVCYTCDDMVGIRNDTCTNGNVLWYFEHQLTLISAPKQELHFVRDGNIVHATLKDGDKTTREKAICSPKDEFNFMKGIEIASSRLFGKPLCLKEDEKSESVKVEKYKRYTLKPYDEVTLHHGIDKASWENIKWGMSIEDVDPYGAFHIIDNRNQRWEITVSDVLREAYPDE